MATNVSAITTAAVVNGSVIPNAASSHSPTRPRRPSTSSSATPPTTGGSTSGTVTSARTRRRPGKSTRASSQASGTPSSRHSPVATVAVTSDSRSASQHLRLGEPPRQAWTRARAPAARRAAAPGRPGPRRRARPAPTAPCRGARGGPAQAGRPRGPRHRPSRRPRRAGRHRPAGIDAVPPQSSSPACRSGRRRQVAPGDRAGDAGSAHLPHIRGRISRLPGSPL